MTDRNPFIPGAPYIRADWVSQATESIVLCAKPFLAYGKLLNAEPHRSFSPTKRPSWLNGAQSYETGSSPYGTLTKYDPAPPQIIVPP